MPDRRIVRERVAGQSAMQRVVALQADARPRTPIARLFGATPLAPGARTAYRVALAELAVGDALDQLGVRWDVLHDLPLASGVLDHLAIGPAGVYAVRAVQCGRADVVAHESALSIGGEPRDDLALATVHAEQAAAILGTTVRPLLALVEPRRVALRAPLPVVRATDLHRTLERAPQTLDGDEVAAISDRADLGSTWPMADAAALDTQQLHRDFATVRAAVRDAADRRVLWIAAGVGVAYGLVWSFAGLLAWAIA